jgi:hypothetical protein
MTAPTCRNFTLRFVSSRSTSSAIVPQLPSGRDSQDEQHTGPAEDAAGNKRRKLENAVNNEDQE